MDLEGLIIEEMDKHNLTRGQAEDLVTSMIKFAAKKEAKEKKSNGN